jgi:hypothetical protein
MNKLEEQFIPLKESFDMKELGFEDDCLAIHSINLMTENEDWELKIGGVWKNQELVDSIKAPMYSQCFDFFRKKYNLYYKIHPCGEMTSFVFSIQDINFETFYDEYKTPEEAEFACLIKLIEIVKTK